MPGLDSLSADRTSLFLPGDGELSLSSVADTMDLQTTTPRYLFVLHTVAPRYNTGIGREVFGPRYQRDTS